MEGFLIQKKRGRKDRKEAVKKAGLLYIFCISVGFVF